MELLALRVEPVEKSSFQADEKICGHVTKDMQVLIFGEELKDRYWVVNLPEQIYINHNKFHYQIGMDWKRGQKEWFYRDCPIRNLFGCYSINSEGKLTLPPFDKTERPIVGRQAANIYSDSKGVHYQVTVTNDQDEVWRDVHTWICFNSFKSPETGHRPYVKVREKWVPFQDLPGAESFCFVAPKGMEENFSRTQLEEEYSQTEKKWKELLAASVSVPGIVAWNFVDEGPLLTFHYAKDAVAVGSNQQWPCTDLFLWFGDIQPGKSETRTGHILIAQTDLANFADAVDEVIAKWE